MSIGREPALYAALAGATIQLLAAFVIDLTADQQAALNATVLAILGVIVAVAVKDGESAAVLGVVQALIALALGFGLHLSPENQAVIMSFASSVVAMFVRTQVTAPVPPPIR